MNAKGGAKSPGAGTCIQVLLQLLIGDQLRTSRNAAVELDVNFTSADKFIKWPYSIRSTSTSKMPIGTISPTF
jgi:hypothetical protein